jgi:hypothetical protein
MPEWMQRYFPRSEEEEELDILAEEQAKAEEELERRKAARAIVECDGYWFLKEFVTTTLRANEPEAAAHEQMLYKVGVRDGVRLISDALDSWEKDDVGQPGTS